MAESVVHGRRFRLAYALLGVCLAAAIAGFVVVVQLPAPKHVPWSVWKPRGDSTHAQASAIAAHVGRGYTQVDALLRWPGQGDRIWAIALRKAPGSSDSVLYHGERSVIYALCGTGANCSIRGRRSDSLLRREALELTLYTLKYVDKIDTVAVLLPPANGSQPSSDALFFRDADLDKPLHKPLRRTFPRLLPAGSLRSIVGRLTGGRDFDFQFGTVAQGGVLILSPRQ
jgi:hypothetical protein